MSHPYDDVQPVRAAVRPTPCRALLVAATAAMLMAVASPGAVAADEPETAAGDNYQIVKATEDRVWRLDKRTGEIAVCTLEGANLVCTTSTDAITPPRKTFAEREAEKREAAEKARKQREEERAKDLAFFDRAIEAIKSLIHAASERDAERDAATEEDAK